MCSGPGRVCLGNGRRSPTLCDTIPGPCLENPQWFVAPKLTTLPAPAHVPLSLGVHLDVPTPAFPRAWVYLVLGCGILHLMVQELLSGTASEWEIRPVKVLFWNGANTEMMDWGRSRNVAALYPLRSLNWVQLWKCLLPVKDEQEGWTMVIITWLCFSTLIFSCGKYFHTV